MYPAWDCNVQQSMRDPHGKACGDLSILAIILLLALMSEKAMAPHSSTSTWKIPWTEEPGGLQSMGSLESDTTERLHFHFSLSFIGEGNGNPLQCSCLENSRDGGAWWAAVSGVAQSRIRLKRLSSSSSSNVVLFAYSTAHDLCSHITLLFRFQHPDDGRGTGGVQD